MSLVHVRFSKATESAETAEYAVEFLDFGPDGEWLPMGKLALYKQSGNYAFDPSEIWKERRGVHPEVFRAPESEWDVLMHETYKDFQMGAWALLVHEYASIWLRESRFPERHPASSFER